MGVDLRTRRLDAAKMSGGTSTPVIYEMLLTAAREQVAPSAEILEFGAGTGTLIAMLRASGWRGRLTGADILPRPAWLDAATCWIERDLNEPLPIADRSFDAVVSTEVIEHLENPRAVFREFSRLLRPGGVLIVTTPNQESIRSLLALAIRGHHVAFLDGSYPAHITPLVLADLERLCAESGFEPPQFRFTNEGGVPGAPRVSWQKLSLGLLKGRRFSDNVLMTSRRRS